MKPPIILRNAALTDASKLAETMAQAFDADPPLNWVLRKDDQRDAAFREFWSICFRRMTFPFGCVDVADDCGAAALWVPPGLWKLDLLTQLSLLPAFVRALSLARLTAGLKAINEIQRHHPSAPHYYLLGMGVNPRRQGQGIGTQLLQRRLAACDAEGAAAYLEASTRNSRALYERMGFVTQQEFCMAPGAPPLWAMWREPRTPSKASGRAE